MRVEDWLKDQPGLFEEIYRITPSLTFINEFTPDTIQMYYEMKHSQRQVTSKFEDKTTTQLASIISVMYSKSWTKVINEFSQTYKLGTAVTRRFVDDTTSLVNRDLTTNGKSKTSPYNSTEDYVGSSSQEDLMTDKTTSSVGNKSDDETTTLDAVVRYRELFADTVLIDRVFEDINEILTLSVYGTASGASYSVSAPSTGGGYVGVAGPQGPKGPEGPQGPAGPRGAAGPAGPEGPAGPKGADGVDGTVSFEELSPGQRESLRGPQGPIGLEGPQGPQGIQGVQGDRGETGPIGLEGPQGPRGLTGPEGPQGPKGDAGADGTMTFEELTPAQVESLRGPQGIQGPEGPQGIQGIQGLPGDRGETGQIGPEGPRGEIGPEGPQGEQGLKGDTGDVGPPPTWVTLTRVEYDALTPDSNTVYLVVEA